MQYTLSYPQDIWSEKHAPIIVTVNYQSIKEYSIQARTFTSHGCKLFLLDDQQQEMFQGEYSYITCDPGFHSKMAVDVAGAINVLLELENKPERVDSTGLEPIMLEVLNKCESVRGTELRDYPYEALVVFK